MFKQDLLHDSRVDLTLKQINKRNHSIKFNILTTSQKKKKKKRCKGKTAKTIPGADCGFDHELLIAKFRLALKKEGKTSRPLKYNLSQISYDYTQEVTNRFNGLDLIEFVTLYRRQ